MACIAVSEHMEQIDSFENISSLDKPAFTPAHRNAVIELADRMGIPVDDVRKLYCIVLGRLAREAKIMDYLPILVSRRVRYLLNKKQRLRLIEGNSKRRS